MTLLQVLCIHKRSSFCVMAIDLAGRWKRQETEPEVCVTMREAAVVRPNMSVKRTINSSVEAGQGSHDCGL
jgi:hypothetical protein